MLRSMRCSGDKNTDGIDGSDGLVVAVGVEGSVETASVTPELASNFAPESFVVRKLTSNRSPFFIPTFSSGKWWLVRSTSLGGKPCLMESTSFCGDELSFCEFFMARNNPATSTESLSRVIMSFPELDRTRSLIPEMRNERECTREKKGRTETERGEKPNTELKVFECLESKNAESKNPECNSSLYFLSSSYFLFPLPPSFLPPLSLLYSLSTLSTPPFRP